MSSAEGGGRKRRHGTSIRTLSDLRGSPGHYEDEEGGYGSGGDEFGGSGGGIGRKGRDTFGSLSSGRGGGSDRDRGGGGGRCDEKCPMTAASIPGLPSSNAAAALLDRVRSEFLPLARRRGWNVLSVSEMCCCGDGLDHAPTSHGRSRRKRRVAPSNVWGYNMTSFGRGGKVHRIHLRLRDPRNHARILPYEDVVGTMSHELAHCVHGPHSVKFYKLMDEIQEQHAEFLARGVVVDREGFPMGSHNAHRLGGGGMGAASGSSRERAVRAARDRAARGRITAGGPRRLGSGGGRGGSGSIASAGPRGRRKGPPLPPREAARLAAERRAEEEAEWRRVEDSPWCLPCNEVISLIGEDTDDGEDGALGGERLEVKAKEREAEGKKCANEAGSDVNAVVLVDEYGGSKPRAKGRKMDADSSLSSVMATEQHKSGRNRQPNESESSIRVSVAEKKSSDEKDILNVFDTDEAEVTECGPISKRKERGKDASSSSSLSACRNTSSSDSDSTVDLTDGGRRPPPTPSPPLPGGFSTSPSDPVSEDEGIVILGDVSAPSAVHRTDKEGEKNMRWSCQGCTFLNGSIALACGACGTVRQPSVGKVSLAASSTALSGLSSDNGRTDDKDLIERFGNGIYWPCGRCTFRNLPLSIRCDACGLERNSAVANTQALSGSASSLDAENLSRAEAIERCRREEVRRSEEEYGGFNIYGKSKKTTRTMGHLT
mmetsp:Transcript_37306/g.111739  ORF Transcript_37306/g.111739 Transcript_37306/m.111739 type:complete len:715 (-) Transcript_37306:168-2312(-)